MGVSACQLRAHGDLLLSATLLCQDGSGGALLTDDRRIAVVTLVHHCGVVLDTCRSKMALPSALQDAKREVCLLIGDVERQGQEPDTRNSQPGRNLRAERMMRDAIIRGRAKPPFFSGVRKPDFADWNF